MSTNLPRRMPGEAPAKIRHFYSIMATKTQGILDPQIRGDGQRWDIGVSKEANSLHMSFVYKGKGWTIPKKPFRLIIDGEDKSDTVDTLAEALAALLGSFAQTSPGAGAVGSPADAARSTAVENRRHAVMRN